MINLFGSPPNLCYDAVVEKFYTTNDTTLLKSPSKSVQFPLSQIQQKNVCLWTNYKLKQ